MNYQQYDMAHFLGSIIKWLAIAAFFILSATLSWGFWSGFIPFTTGWFPYSGMGLTEGGFLGWMAVFMLTRHDPFSKVLALIMTIVSGLCCFIVAFYEFTLIMARHSSASVFGNNDTINNLIVCLGIVFLAHGVCFVVDMFHAYFARPGNNFRNPAPRGNLIPAQFAQVGNLIPAQEGNKNPARVDVQELQEALTVVTGYLTAISGGETADPLAARQLPRPQTEVNEKLEGMGEMASAALSTLTSAARSFTRRGKRAGRVPGGQKGTTGESMPDSSMEMETPPDEEV